MGKSSVRKEKMMPPAYQDIPSAVIPAAHFDGGIARVIAGSYFGIEGPAKAQIPTRILDVGLKPYEEWRVDTTSGNELFICVYDGTIEGVNKRGNCCKAEAPTIILFEGDGDVIVAAGRGGANILYCEGRPINEPVVKYGPFVMIPGGGPEGGRGLQFGKASKRLTLVFNLF